MKIFKFLFFSIVVLFLFANNLSAQDEFYGNLHTTATEYAGADITADFINISDENEPNMVYFYEIELDEGGMIFCSPDFFNGSVSKGIATLISEEEGKVKYCRYKVENTRLMTFFDKDNNPFLSITLEKKE